MANTSTSGSVVPATGNTGDIFKKTSGNDQGYYYCVAPDVWRFANRCAAVDFDPSVFCRGDGTWAVPPGGSGIPTGSIHFWTTSSAPSGYILCDGSAVSRTTESALFAVIGVVYGAGDGSTTFNVPNLKGKVVVALDSAQTEFDTLGETSGAKTVTLDSTMIPSHTHIQDAHTHTQNSHNHTQDAHTHTQNSFAPRIINSGTAGTVGVQGASAASNANASNAATTATNQNATATNQAATAVNQNATATNQNTGGGLAHNNLQPYIVLNGIIKN